MTVICSEKELNDIFNKIFQTKKITDIIDDKFDLLHRFRIYELKYFFEYMEHSEFESYTPITYKDEDGVSFIYQKLQYFSKPSLSSETKESLFDIVDDLYNCFNIVFPWDRFPKTREKALNIAQENGLAMVSKGSKLAEDVTQLKAALGLDATKAYSEEVKSLFGISDIAKIEQDSKFLLQRMADIKSQVENAEKNFSNEANKLLDELKEENSKYKNQLKEDVNKSVNDVIDDVRIHQDEISDIKQNIKLLQKRLNDINNGVYNEELARYFLTEHDKLKGKVDSLMLVVQIIISLFWESTISHYWLKEIWKMTLVMRIEVFAICMLLINIIYYIYLYFSNSEDVKAFVDNWKGVLTPYWCWLGATFSGMGSLLYLAIKVCFIYEINEFSYKYMLPYVSIYFVLIWFTWFSAKQFSYTKQICDEYEYKYALSKSYLSYRNEALDVVLTNENNTLVLALLESLINNIARSPVQSVKQDVHSPFSEAFGAVKDIIKKQD